MFGRSYFLIFSVVCAAVSAQDIPTFLSVDNDPTSRGIREARNLKFNKRLPFSMLEATPGRTHPSQKLMFSKQAELPYDTSDTVVTGEVVRIQPYLSADRKAIYTEYTIRVNEVVKENGSSVIYSGSLLTLLREGGIGRQPDQKILHHNVIGDVVPNKQEQYLFFLIDEPALAGFYYRKIWLIQDGVLRPLFADDIALGKGSQYAGTLAADAVIFLKSKSGR